MQYVRCVNNEGYAVSLTVGAVYKQLPTNELEQGSIRIVDNSGEDYLFAPNRFEPVVLIGKDNSHADKSVTAHIPTWLHGVLNAEALAANKSVSALVRQLIEERFDLPTAA